MSMKLMRGLAAVAVAALMLGVGNPALAAEGTSSPKAVSIPSNIAPEDSPRAAELREALGVIEALPYEVIYQGGDAIGSVVGEITGFNDIKRGCFE